MTRPRRLIARIPAVVALHHALFRRHPQPGDYHRPILGLAEGGELINSLPRDGRPALAAHAKQSGKLAIHMGGATQILFGIKGRRWDDHDVISRLYNDSWVRPQPREVPARAMTVEGGCYWSAWRAARPGRGLRAPRPPGPRDPPGGVV